MTDALRSLPWAYIISRISAGAYRQDKKVPRSYLYDKVCKELHMIFLKHLSKLSYPVLLLLQ